MWVIRYTREFRKQIKKIDRLSAARILDYMDEVAALENPRARGRALIRDLRGFWRYRIGDYRVIAEIHDSDLVIIGVEVGHRRSIYN
jgi:mRNA interferase RelE/StbE